MDIINAIITLATTGGVLYLIIEKIFSRKKDTAEAKSVEIANGNDVPDLYNKIDEIVERKTAPIKTELVDVKGQLEEMKSTWCCYREDCQERILYKKRDIELEALSRRCHTCEHKP